MAACSLAKAFSRSDSNEEEEDHLQLQSGSRVSNDL